jgi:hypothetical protein
MGAPAEPRIIADLGRLVVAEDGPLVLIFDRGDGTREITAFVLAVATLVCGGFGAVTTVMAAAGSAPVSMGIVGAVLLTVGVLAGIGVFVIVRSLRRARAAPLRTTLPVAVFDRNSRLYLDGRGEVVAPLDQVRFERRMQLGSSSPKLVVSTPGGTKVLMKGNPFAGAIGNADEVLTAVVHRA